MSWKNCKKCVSVPRSSYTSTLFKVLLSLKILHGGRTGSKGATFEDIAMHMIKHFNLDGDIKSQVLASLKYGVKMHFILKKKDKFSLILPASSIFLAPCKCKSEETERIQCIFPPKWHSNVCNDVCSANAEGSCCGKAQRSKTNVCCDKDEQDEEDENPCALCKKKNKPPPPQNSCNVCEKKRKRSPCPPPPCHSRPRSPCPPRRRSSCSPRRHSPCPPRRRSSCSPRRRSPCPPRRRSSCSPRRRSPCAPRRRSPCPPPPCSDSESESSSSEDCCPPPKKSKPCADSCPKIRPPVCASRKRKTKRGGCPKSVYDDYCQMCPQDDDDDDCEFKQAFKIGAHKNCSCCSK